MSEQQQAWARVAAATGYPLNGAAFALGLCDGVEEDAITLLWAVDADDDATDLGDTQP